MINRSYDDCKFIVIWHVFGGQTASNGGKILEIDKVSQNRLYNI